MDYREFLFARRQIRLDPVYECDNRRTTKLVSHGWETFSSRNLPSETRSNDLPEKRAVDCGLRVPLTAWSEVKYS